MKPFFLLLALSFATVIHAQDVDIDKVFEDFKQKQQQEFDDFKSKADEEFSAFLREAWERFETSEPIPAPLRPEPVVPTVFDGRKPTTTPVQVTPRAPVADDEPYVPVPVDKPVVRPGSMANKTTIRFYGTPFPVATDAIAGLSLAGSGEASVADAWAALCKANHEPLINDCMTLKEEKRLGDWGYIQLTKKIGEQLYGNRRANDIAFLQMFILNKSGYKVRLAKINEELKLLVAPSGVLYGLPYITLSGVKYYVLEPPKQRAASIFTYPQEFSGAKNQVVLFLNAVPDFDDAPYARELRAKNGVTAQAVVNRNLIDFYKDYPLCGIPPHYKAPASEALRKSLYPALQTAIRGMSQQEAANTLIGFVQTAFDYQTDGEQFGYEKPYFQEESIFYPYNDCEDRAMLYAALIKDFLGLEVVLLDYPNHIASAIRFTEDIAGDYVLIDGKKFLICDPTYIGASIGMCMDEYKNVSPGIIR